MSQEDGRPPGGKAPPKAPVGLPRPPARPVPDFADLQRTMPGVPNQVARELSERDLPRITNPAEGVKPPSGPSLPKVQAPAPPPGTALPRIASSAAPPPRAPPAAAPFPQITKATVNMKPGATAAPTQQATVPPKPAAGALPIGLQATLLRTRHATGPQTLPPTQPPTDRAAVPTQPHGSDRAQLPVATQPEAAPRGSVQVPTQPLGARVPAHLMPTDPLRAAPHVPQHPPPRPGSAAAAPPRPGLLSPEPPTRPAAAGAAPPRPGSAAVAPPRPGSAAVAPPRAAAVPPEPPTRASGPVISKPLGPPPAPRGFAAAHPPGSTSQEPTLAARPSNAGRAQPVPVSRPPVPARPTEGPMTLGPEFAVTQPGTPGPAALKALREAAVPPPVKSPEPPAEPPQEHVSTPFLPQPALTREAPVVDDAPSSHEVPTDEDAGDSDRDFAADADRDLAPTQQQVNTLTPARGVPAAAPAPVEVRDVVARPASLVRRFIAWTVDTTLWLGCASAYFVFLRSKTHKGGPLTSPEAVLAWLKSLGPRALVGVGIALALLALFTALFTVLNKGRTPGRMLAGLRLVTGSGDRPGVIRAVLRAGFAMVSFAAFLGGFWLALVDRRGQTLHDKLTGTFVVRVDPQGT